MYSRYGEIDILALRSNQLHVVEVKNYKPDSLVPSIYSITPSKLLKLEMTLDTILENLEINYDTVVMDALLVQKNIVVEHIINIT